MIDNIESKSINFNPNKVNVFFWKKKSENFIKTYLCHHTKPFQLENKKFLPIKF